MKNLILGTAGHIDHGKTSLVKALTGVDTDRLPEEKSRGITIELGFAELDLGDGLRLGIVDVPGHERFVRTMVAGVGGIDIVMLVIAADEGIMPQTREHLAICGLLGIRKGFVALTKTDLVDADWLQLVIDEVKQFITGSFLQDGAVIPVSSRTGTGLDRLRDELRLISSESCQKNSNGPFRLPVDRAFTVGGFGTVVTGTLLSGQVSVGDEVEILPSAIETRIRGIQNHSSRVDKGYAGQRLALNLQGIELQQVKRGDVVAPRGIYRSTKVVDVTLDLLKTCPKNLKSRSSLRLHSGTYEVDAKVMLIDCQFIEPGKSAFARLRLEHPVLLLHGDPFVLRTSSPSETVAGGRILDPSPPARRRNPVETVEMLENMMLGAETESIANMVSASLLTGVSFTELSKRTGFAVKKLETLLAPMLSSGKIIQVLREPAIYLSRDAFTSTCSVIMDELNSYIHANPLKDGIGREELKTRLPARSDQRFFSACLKYLENRGALTAEQNLVKVAGGRKSATPDAERIMLDIEDQLNKSGLEPFSVKQLTELLKLPVKSVLDHLNLLIRSNRAVKVNSDLYYAYEPFRSIELILMAHLKEKKEITPGEFRELTGLSRKFTIPLLEYFDSQKLTIRVGDKRILRKS